MKETKKRKKNKNNPNIDIFSYTIFRNSINKEQGERAEEETVIIIMHHYTLNLLLYIRLAVTHKSIILFMQIPRVHFLLLLPRSTIIKQRTSQHLYFVRNNKKISKTGIIIIEENKEVLNRMSYSNMVA
jgi:hypothetical protein